MVQARKKPSSVPSFFFMEKKAPLAEHFPVGICRNGKAFCFCTLKVFAPQCAGGNVVVARRPVFGVVSGVFFLIFRSMNEVPSFTVV